MGSAERPAKRHHAATHAKQRGGEQNEPLPTWATAFIGNVASGLCNLAERCLGDDAAYYRGGNPLPADERFDPPEALNAVHKTLGLTDHGGWNAFAAFVSNSEHMRDVASILYDVIPNVENGPKWLPVDGDPATVLIAKRRRIGKKTGSADGGGAPEDVARAVRRRVAVGVELILRRKEPDTSPSATNEANGRRRGPAAWVRLLYRRSD